MKRNRKIKLEKWQIISVVCILVCLILALIFADFVTEKTNFYGKLASNQTTKNKVETSDYYVSYIDVGQGSSTFAKLPDGKTLVIDGGNVEYGETVVNFLNKHSVSKIDYLIATHADSDHIGGLNDVLENFEVKNIFRPFQIAVSKFSQLEVYADEDLKSVYDYLEQNENLMINKVSSDSYRTFITNIYSEEFSIGNETYYSSVNVFYDGLKITGKNYKIEFFAPLKADRSIDISNYCDRTGGFVTKIPKNDSNDCSAIFTLTCNNKDKFLFMGDARYTEKNPNSNDYSEYVFLESLTDDELKELSKVDVLLVAHHGSGYSTSKELLETTLPEFVVISVGKNSYGHPTQSLLERLKNLKGTNKDFMLRTDTGGDIEFTNVGGKLMYCLSTESKLRQLTISFRLVCIAMSTLVIIVIFSVKPKRNNPKDNFIDRN